MRAAAGDTLRIMLPTFAQVCPFADECTYSPSLAFDACKHACATRPRARMPAAVLSRAVRLGAQRHSRFAFEPVGIARPVASATTRSARCLPTGGLRCDRPLRSSRGR